MNELYEVSPFTDIAVGNKPPVIRFDATGPTIQGPIALRREGDCAHGHHVGGTVAAGVGIRRCEVFERINAPQRNPPPPVILHWSKYRGPGEVTFDKPPPVFEKTRRPGACSTARPR